MVDDQIWQEILSAVREETDNPSLEIRKDMNASDVPGWDSLAHIRILLTLDARLGITIDVKKTYQAATIADLIPIVKAAGA